VNSERKKKLNHLVMYQGFAWLGKN